MRDNVLKVMLWGEEVGRLQWIDMRKIACFTFHPDFVRKGWNIAPLLSPLDEIKPHVPIYGERSSAGNRLYQGLPPFIADSLPDAWGNELFELWAKENKIHEKDKTPVDKLAFVGRRGMGAFEFEPDFDVASKVSSLELSSLYALSEKIFQDRSKAIITPDESLSVKSLIAVGASAGGRQAKAIVAIAPDGTVKSGQIAGLEGYKYCLLKFGNKERMTAELEKTYYDMAVAAGIDMMPCSLLNVDGVNHFMTERFDRPQGEKVHVQTLAAMNPDAESYDDLLRVCRRIGVSEREQVEIFRRMVFNVFANNTDDHNKNFSFMMNRNGEWHITPAYDMTFIFATDGVNREKHHCLSLQGKTDGFSVDDLLNFASRNSIKRPESIIRKVLDSVASFRDFAKVNGVSSYWINCIEEHLYGLVPDEYKEKMSSWKPNQFSETIKGHSVSNVRLEMSANGNIHLMAVIDGFERKYVIAPKRVEFMEIMEKGFNTMPDAQKMEFVERFMLPLS